MSPLSQRKITALAKKIPQERGLVTLTGEAYMQGRGRAFVLEAAPIAGVKKRRQVPDGFRVGKPREMT